MGRAPFSVKALCLAPFTATDFKAAVFGGLFGGLASFLVTHLLLELTFSPVFSTFFAVLLASIAVLVIQRALAIDPPVPPPALAYDDDEDVVESGTDKSLQNMYSTQVQTRRLLFGFAAMLLISATFAVFVDKAWFSNINWVIKIPMYCLLGNTLCFLLVFAGVDIVNFYYDVVWWEGRASACGPGAAFGGAFAGNSGMPGGASSPSLPVHNSSQVCVLVIGSLLLGSVFGFFYGLFDLEDIHSSVRLIQDRYVCVPIAVIIGTFTAVIAARLGRASNSEGSRIGGTARLAGSGLVSGAGSSAGSPSRTAGGQHSSANDDFLDDEEDEEDATFFGQQSRSLAA
ncbi:hypothetical protein BESB_054540 [Besnoitia besnoiti]|uniref:Transmembrane protein n=1 Tax=Besnoitia besnoiti TaxID=94643 RepID=A0A2A9MJH4_BESBE|nr:hypothetical protein BESB_054540 [Besnoitia besnoiti]PFH35803.1 hypothetical protein BESB_054540 [Besnoitia besnoiti]